MTPSRRAFIQALGAGGLALTGCGRASAPEAQPAVSAPQPQVQPTAADRSRVVIARDPQVLNGRGEVDSGRLRALLDRAMMALTGAQSAAEAWRQLFSPRDVVALKVNALAGPDLSTHPELCHAVAAGLAAGGVPEDQVIVYDRFTEELAVLGLEPNRRGRGMRVLGSDETGYDPEPTVVKAVGTCFSRILSELATAVINLPVLKDHDLAGLSGALKNHYGSIHNPNKLHLDHCHPYIADLNCAEVIRAKQRLVICDALRVCYEGGPAFNPEATVSQGTLLVTTDAVAADAVGLQMLEDLRVAHGLAPIMSQERAPRYIALAAEYGLGNAAMERIEKVQV